MRYLFVLLVFVVAACTPTAAEPLPPLPTFALEPEDIGFLYFWQTETGELSGAGDFEQWQFGGEAGDNIFIRTVSRGVESRIILYQGDTILAEGTNSIEFTLPASVLYQVRVEWLNGSGQYDIGVGYTDQSNPEDVRAPIEPTVVVGVPTPTPPFSSLGEFISQLNEAGEYPALLTEESRQHVYTIQGSAGMVVNFELYQIAGTFDPMLRLYDADSNLIAMDDNSLGNRNARLLNVRLPNDELYVLQVDGKGLTGDYTLNYLAEAIRLEPDSQPTLEATSVAPYETPMVRFAVPDQRLEDHSPAINSIVREGDFQRFSFTAEAGERLSIVVEPLEGAAILPQFEVFDPDGAQVAFADSITSNANGAATANGIIIAQSGTHTIIVTSQDNTTGQFIISFGRGASVRDEFQGFAFSNTQTTATIESVGTRHIWQLNLDPGDVISVAVSPIDRDFDPVIELVTVEGEVIYRDDDGGADNAALIQLANIVNPATYLLRVFDESGTNIGGYTLLWNFVNIAPTPTAVPASIAILAVDGRVDDNAYQFYAFQGQAGQTLQIEVIAHTEQTFDPVLAVLNPSGEIILEADDNGSSLNPSTSITLPEDGTYQIRVNGYLSSGQFTLRVALLFN